MVGAEGFEPPTLCSQSVTGTFILIYSHLLSFTVYRGFSHIRQLG